ncbi:hypothetical protein HYH03_016790 [Edaphochlamys debaryana]|uniref:Uncharacterized protein n=1 Tax=Edaphochlamys debaryana TaxID=47281 RepID=A0A836BR32_9CHLO|nr:hypothetical protein HYH03_016790 [Edaphochlamys debaryana]|eukprot:KAG2484374.1 hypothetical protein HYH03_016790 [Edaphochlamys debaryana]
MSPRKLNSYSTAEECIAGLQLAGKVALVTGGSSGIGVETCRALALAGARVYLGARSPADAVVEDIKRSGGADVHVLRLDLADLSSVRSAAETLAAAEPGGLHMLVLNAGVMACPLARTRDGLEMQSGVNHVGHFYLTQLLLPLLQCHGQPARVVWLSSSAHAFLWSRLRLDDLNWEQRAARYSPWDAYLQSKVYNILFVRQLAKRLQGSPVSAFAVHPGMIESALQRHQSSLFRWGLRWLAAPFRKTTQQGAATSVYAATAPELDGRSGDYLSDCRPVASSSVAADMAAAEALWGATEALLQRALAEELRGLAPGGGP